MRSLDDITSGLPIQPQPVFGHLLIRYLYCKSKIMYCRQLSKKCIALYYPSTKLEVFLNAELWNDFALLLRVALLTVKLLLTDWKNVFFFFSLTVSLSGLTVCNLHSPGHFHPELLRLWIRDPLWTRARRLHCSWCTCRWYRAMVRRRKFVSEEISWMMTR